MIQLMPISEFNGFKNRVEKATGFTCFETQPDDQTVWYGTSDKFDDFKEMVGEEFPTGTIAYLMDTSKKNMYSKTKKQWYVID